MLELRYARDVERAHGLPPARRRSAEAVAGRRVVRDADYHPYGVLVELDGRIGHERESDRFRDRHRDNRAALTGRLTLRYGWSEVTDDPCGIAAEVAAALAAGGW